jgi:hypothetical protein
MSKTQEYKGTVHRIISIPGYREALSALKRPPHRPGLGCNQKYQDLKKIKNIKILMNKKLIFPTCNERTEINAYKNFVWFKRFTFNSQMTFIS